MPTLIEAPWHKFSKRLMKVRTEVFVREQGIPAELEQDHWDEKSFHVILATEGEDVAAGRLLPTGYIGRVCVLKDYRGKGLGKDIMLALIQRAKDENMQEVALSSQVSALNFYLSLGFEKCSEEYMEAGIPHVKMKKEI